MTTANTTAMRMLLLRKPASWHNPWRRSLSDRDGETGTGAVAEAHDEEHDGAGCAYCRKCSHAYPSSHDGGVDDEVHLLKDVTQDEWNRKFDDGSQGRAYRHVIS